MSELSPEVIVVNHVVGNCASAVSAAVQSSSAGHEQAAMPKWTVHTFQANGAWARQFTKEDTVISSGISSRI